MRNLKQVILGSVTLLFLLACNLLPGQTTPGEEQLVESPAPDKFTVVQLEYSDTSLSDLLKAEVQKAKVEGRSPYVEFYADWVSRYPIAGRFGNNPKYRVSWGAEKGERAGVFRK